MYHVLEKRKKTQLSQCVYVKNVLFDTVRFEQHIRQLVARQQYYGVWECSPNCVDVLIKGYGEVENYIQK